MTARRQMETTVPTFITHDPEPPSRPPSDLLDLRPLSLAEVMAMPETVLRTALLRVLAEAEAQTDAVAGFQSSI